MKYGTREFGEASCKVLKPIALPMHLHNDVREITKVFVPKETRGQKLATKLLEQVCREADKFKMILMIHVHPFDDEPMDIKQLANWYGSTFNFNQIQEDPMLMARMPAILVRTQQKVVTNTIQGAFE